MSRAPNRRHTAIYLSAQLLARLSGDMLLGDCARTERELLKRSRELVRLLERKLLGRRRPGRRNVIDLQRRRSLRTVEEAMGIYRPDREPPRAA